MKATKAAKSARMSQPLVQEWNSLESLDSIFASCGKIDGTVIQPPNYRRSCACVGLVHDTADVSQTSAPLRVQGGALAVAALFLRRDFLQDERAPIVGDHVLSNVRSGISKTVANEVCQVSPPRFIEQAH